MLAIIAKSRTFLVYWLFEGGFIDLYIKWKWFFMIFHATSMCVCVCLCVDAHVCYVHALLGGWATMGRMLVLFWLIAVHAVDGVHYDYTYAVYAIRFFVCLLFSLYKIQYNRDFVVFWTCIFLYIVHNVCRSSSVVVAPTAHLWV